VENICGEKSTLACPEGSYHSFMGETSFIPKGWRCLLSSPPGLCGNVLDLVAQVTEQMEGKRDVP